MSISTAARIRQGADDLFAGPHSEKEEDQEILARVRALSAGARLRLRERDQLLYLIVGRYRTGPPDKWAPLLLEVIVRPLMARLVHLQPPDGIIDYEDISQQLVVEVLDSAMTIPLKGPEYLERRILLRAATRVVRWLNKEIREQAFWDGGAPQ